MDNSTQVAASRAITVPFHGADLYVVEHNGQPYTPMKPIVQAMGLDWGSQFRKVAANETRWGIVNLTIPSAGGEQAMTCLPVRKTAAWLTTIEPGKVKNPEVRARVIQYQNECDDVLWQYWNEGIAINPRVPYTVQPSDTLNEAQQTALRAMLESNVKRLPMEKRGEAMRQGWGKLFSHFKVPYRKIPASEFEEALSILTRHVVEWEVVDEAPKAETVNDIVADWVRKIEEPNGYPAILFMPLVNAVLRKMGFTLPGSELPRLALTMTPPPSSSYKYDRANPYPRNGRTIEVAKSIVADIRDWSDNLPAGPAKRDLYDATDTLYGLLVSGWTEVDEALGQLSTAMHYLNRWQGRGGRMGNIS